MRYILQGIATLRSHAITESIGKPSFTLIGRREQSAKLVKVLTVPNGVAHKFKWRDEPSFTRTYRPTDFFILPADRFNVPVAEVLARVPDTFSSVLEAQGALIKFRVHLY